VMAAVRNNGLALKFANFNLQRDEQVVTTAVHNDVCALQFAFALRSDAGFINSLIQNDNDLEENEMVFTQDDRDWLSARANRSEETTPPKIPRHYKLRF